MIPGAFARDGLDACIEIASKRKERAPGDPMGSVDPIVVTVDPTDTYGAAIPDFKFSIY